MNSNIESRRGATAFLRSSYPYLTIIIIAIIFFTFRIKIHTWESYMYAGALKGEIDVNYQFSLHNEEAQRLPEINIYNPNHPLLHLLTYLLYSFLGGLGLRVSPLALTQLANLSGAVLTLLVLYRLTFRLWGDRLTSTLTVVVTAFTALFWYQANSGEVYIYPLLFILLSFKSLVRLEQGGSFYGELVKASLFAGLALAFHLLAALYLPASLCFLFLLQRREQKFALLKSLSLMTAGGVVSYFIFYLLPYLTIYRTGSAQLYFRLISLYSAIFGLWTGKAPAGGAGLLKILFNLKLGAEHLVRSLANCSFIIIYPVIAALLLLLVRAALRKRGAIYARTFLFWLLLYFLLITIPLNLPDVNDYWLFLLVPLLLPVIGELREVVPHHLLKGILLVLGVTLFIYNGANDIFPKSLVKDKDYFVLSELKGRGSLGVTATVTLINYQIYHELYYLQESFPANRHYYLHEQSEYVEPNFERDLGRLLGRISGRKAPFLLVSAAENPSLEMVRGRLARRGFSEELILKGSRNMDDRLYKTSVGEGLGDYFIVNELVVYRYTRVLKESL